MLMSCGHRSMLARINCAIFHIGDRKIDREKNIPKTKKNYIQNPSNEQVNE